MAQSEPQGTATVVAAPTKTGGSLAQTGGGSIIAFILLGVVALGLGALLRSGRR